MGDDLPLVRRLARPVTDRGWSLLGHLGQRFNDLLLGVIDILQTMDRQVLHRFYVARGHFTVRFSPE